MNARKVLHQENIKITNSKLKDCLRKPRWVASGVWLALSKGIVDKKAVQIDEMNSA